MWRCCHPVATIEMACLRAWGYETKGDPGPWRSFPGGASLVGLPWWLRGWSICPQCGRHGLNPWVGKIPWRRKWQPTLPGTLAWRIPWMGKPVGYSPWDCKELDMTERLHFHFSLSGTRWCSREGEGGPWRYPAIADKGLARMTPWTSTLTFFGIQGKTRD